MLNQLNLFGEIGSDVKAKDVKAILASMDQTQPLLVKIDSGGGSVFEGFSIANALEEYPGPKKAIIEPCAFSIASYIAAVFDDVEIVANGYVMAHMPYIEQGGTAAELAQNATLLADMEAKLVARYVAKTGMSEWEVRALLNREEFLNATQAQAIGLVTSVVKSQKQTRSPLEAKAKLPLQVYASLRCESLSGENSEPTEEQSMSNPQPVAATVSEIKAAFPKAKAEFIVRCMEQGMPMPAVQQAMSAELQSENDQMLARISAMEQEIAALKAQAEVVVVPNEEEKPDEGMVSAKAKSGARPIARATTSSPAAQSAKVRWQKAIDECLPLAGNKVKAAAMANRKNPGLREEMLAEVNS